MSDAQAGFRTYIGLRYVPVIKGVWDNSIEYEALSIVVYQGNSYTSKKPVPIGVDINNDTYWVMTGNYNVQVANLQNEVEVAVRQIMDYATDFENFKSAMMKLYDDFVVDADGQVAESVAQFEAEIGEQYEAFQRYVTDVLARYRNDMDSFTQETTQRINDFINNTTTDINNRFRTIENNLDEEMNTFTNTTEQDVLQLKSTVNNLVLQAGNPESSSAEIVQARTNRTKTTAYNTLQDSINGLVDNGLFYHTLTAIDYETINLDSYTSIGVYASAVGELVNSPFGTITNQGIAMIVYTDKSRIVVQDLTLRYNGRIYRFVRNRYSGTWSNWNEYVTNDKVMSYSIGEHELDGEPYKYDFNSLLPNTCYFMNGYESGYKPKHSPLLLASGIPYAIKTFGTENNKYQLIYTSASNRVFIRICINGVWTSWDYLATKDDLDSMHATISSETNTKLTKKVSGENVAGAPESINQLNAHEFANFGLYTVNLYNSVLPNRGSSGNVICYVFNHYNTQVLLSTDGCIYYRTKTGDTWSDFTDKSIEKLGIEFVTGMETGVTKATLDNFVFDDDVVYKIHIMDLPDTNTSKFCYIISRTSGNIKVRTIITDTGVTYTEKYSNGAWGDFKNNNINYLNDFSNVGMTLTELNNAVLSETRINAVRLGFDLYTNGNIDDRFCWVKQFTKGTSPNTEIHQVYTTATGLVFHRQWSESTGTWGNFESQYYTKSEIDAMLNP